MARVIVMPKMGEAMEEGQVTEWLIKEGESVEKNQPLFELMTDKTTMEFPAPEDGTLLKILVECDEDYPCGTPIAILGQPVRIYPVWSEPRAKERIPCLRHLRSSPTRGCGR